MKNLTQINEEYLKNYNSEYIDTEKLIAMGHGLGATSAI